MSESEALTAETLREIVKMSGIDIPEAEIEAQLEALRTRLGATRDWHERDLGVSFEDGECRFVHPAHCHQHRWDVPTSMNGNRSPPQDGEDGNTNE